MTESQAYSKRDAIIIRRDLRSMIAQNNGLGERLRQAARGAYRNTVCKVCECYEVLSVHTVNEVGIVVFYSSLNLQSKKACLW